MVTHHNHCWLRTEYLLDRIERKAFDVDLDLAVMDTLVELHDDDDDCSMDAVFGKLYEEAKTIRKMCKSNQKSIPREFQKADGIRVLLLIWFHAVAGVNSPASENDIM